MKSLQNALPCSKRSLFLRRRIEQRLLRSYASIRTIVRRENFQAKDQVFQQKIKSLQEARQPLNPFLFAIYAQILKACEMEDNDTVLKLLDEACQLEGGVSRRFINYEDPPITSKQWENFTYLATREIREPTFLAPCRPIFFHQACKDILKAEACLAQAVPDLYEEYHVLVHQFFLLESQRFVAGSTFDLQGAILLKIDASVSVLDLIDFIIHETSHQYLFLLSTLDPLCLNSPDELHPSPLRQEPRPVLGNYHSFFVLARLVYGLSLFKERAEHLDIDLQKLNEKLSFYRDTYLASFPAFRKTLHLTRVGDNFLRSLQSIFK